MEDKININQIVTNEEIQADDNAETVDLLKAIALTVVSIIAVTLGTIYGSLF